MRNHPLRALSLLAVLALAFLATACQSLPIRVGLQDVTINLGVITSTQGVVLYPAGGSAFQRSDLHVASASIDGDVDASGLSSSTTFTFYGRVQDPASDANCQQVTNLTDTYYACPASQETSISSAVTVPADGTAQPIHLGGDVLAAAANQGKVWIGASVRGGASTNATLHFTQLVASVALL